MLATAKGAIHGLELHGRLHAGSYKGRGAGALLQQLCIEFPQSLRCADVVPGAAMLLPRDLTV